MLNKFLALTAAATLAFATPLMAQDAEAPIETVATGAFNLELNNANELEDGACRLVYVAENGTDTDVEKATYEVAVFDSQNIVSKMLLLEFGALQASKTRVLQFDIPNQTCGEISRILVNNQVDCATAAGESSICTTNLATRTLETEIEFTH